MRLAIRHNLPWMTTTTTTTTNSSPQHEVTPKDTVLSGDDSYSAVVESLLASYLSKHSITTLQSTTIDTTFVAFVRNALFNPQTHPLGVTTLSNPAQLDFRVRYKRSRPSAQPKVDICSFTWFKTEAELNLHLLETFKGTIPSLRHLTKCFGLWENLPIQFLDDRPGNDFIITKKKSKYPHDEISSRIDMVIIYVQCSASAFFAAITSFEHRHPEFITYLKTDGIKNNDGTPAKLFQVITVTEHTCYVIINFGLFYLFKAESLHWMPNHSLKAELIFENYVRRLSSKYFPSQKAKTYKGNLDSYKLDIVIRTLFNNLFPKSRGTGDRIMPPVLNKLDFTCINHYMQLPHLVSFHREHRGRFFSRDLLLELLRSQQAMQSPTKYFANLQLPSSLGQVSLYEAVMNHLLGCGQEQRNHVGIMVRTGAINKLYETLAEQLREASAKRQRHSWVEDPKMQLFYRLLGVLARICRLYRVNPSQSNLLDSDWVHWTVPLLEWDNKALPHRNARSVYLRYQRYRQNSRAYDLTKERDRTKIALDSVLYSSNDSSGEESSQNSLYRSRGTFELDDYKNIDALLTKTLNMEGFESFTDIGYQSFEQATLEEEREGGQPIMDGKTKEQRLADHITSEMDEVIKCYLNISDCISNTTILVFPDKSKPSSTDPTNPPDHSDRSLPRSLDQLETFEPHTVFVSDILYTICNGSIPGTWDNFKKPASTKRKRKNDDDDDDNEIMYDELGREVIRPPPKRRKTGSRLVDVLVPFQEGDRRFMNSHKNTSRENLLVRHFVTNSGKNKLSGKVKTKGAVSFECFRLYILNNRTREQRDLMAPVVDKFFSEMLFKLLLGPEYAGVLSPQLISTLLRSISRIPKTRLSKKKKKKTVAPVVSATASTTGSNNPEALLSAQEMEMQHHLLVRKVRNHLGGEDDEVQGESQELQYQTLMVQKYDPFVKFNQPTKDTGFGRMFEADCAFDLSNPTVVSHLKHWKEFLRVAMFYSFVKGELQQVPNREAVSWLNLKKGEDDNDTINTCIQILDTGNVESLPTTDSLACFNRPLKYVVNIDGRKGYDSNNTPTSTGTLVGVAVPAYVSKTMRMVLTPEDGMEDLDLEDDEADTDEEGFDDEEAVDDSITIEGTPLYDTETFYIHCTGIVDSSHLHLTTTTREEYINKWVCEFLAVDAYHLWLRANGN